MSKDAKRALRAIGEVFWWCYCAALIVLLGWVLVTGIGQEHTKHAERVAERVCGTMIDERLGDLK